MHFYQTERVALFIDGANLYATAKAIGFDIDYKKLLALFRARSQLVRALYYTALAEDQEYSSIRPLVDWLDYNGYTMVTKPTKEFVDSLGRRKIKGNMDIELTVDAMRLSEQLDHIVLFTGDGDFRALVAALQLKGKRVSVISTLQTQPAMVADELRRQADQFIDLADLEQFIGRENTARQAREIPAVVERRESASPARTTTRRTAVVPPSAPASASTLDFPDDDDK
ncbi:MAG TPA: NYN domain-containing protein [Hyphomicrobiaceae bacterium]|nr:NYN domain-containing protein [Hyphomicrobiaceae bacterium]